MSSTDWKSLKKVGDDAINPAPPGTYVLEVMKADYKKASTGSDMIAMQLKVVDGPSTGKTLFNNVVFTPDSGFALSRFFSTMDSFGITIDHLSQLIGDIPDQFRQLAPGLVGRRVNAELKVDVYQGRQKNEIAQWLPAAPGTIQPMLASNNGIPTPGVSVGGNQAGPPVPTMTTTSSEPPKVAF